MEFLMNTETLITKLQTVADLISSVLSELTEAATPTASPSQDTPEQTAQTESVKVATSTAPVPVRCLMFRW